MDTIFSFCMNMTAWQWMSFGVAFLSFELMFPGILMGWLGMGAFLTAVLVYFTGFTGIPAMVTFLVLGAVVCVFGRKCCYKKCTQ